MSEYGQSRREGKIKFGYDFNNIAEVTGLWGAEVNKNPYHTYFNIPRKGGAICVQLKEESGNGWKHVRHLGAAIDNRGWHEILRIDEFNDDVRESVARVKEELSKPVTRYVFWREEREGTSWYKFYGVFKLDADATRKTLDSEDPMCIYAKVSDVGELISDAV